MFSFTFVTWINKYLSIKVFVCSSHFVCIYYFFLYLGFGWVQVKMANQLRGTMGFLKLTPNQFTTLLGFCLLQKKQFLTRSDSGWFLLCYQYVSYKHVWYNSWLSYKNNKPCTVHIIYIWSPLPFVLDLHAATGTVFFILGLGVY